MLHKEIGKISREILTFNGKICVRTQCLRQIVSNTAFFDRLIECIDNHATRQAQRQSFILQQKLERLRYIFHGFPSHQMPVNLSAPSDNAIVEAENTPVQVEEDQNRNVLVTDMTNSLNSKENERRNCLKLETDEMDGFVSELYLHLGIHNE